MNIRRSCKRVPKKLDLLECKGNVSRLSAASRHQLKVHHREHFSLTIFSAFRNTHSIYSFFFASDTKTKTRNSIKLDLCFRSLRVSVMLSGGTALTRRNARDQERFRNKFHCDNFRFLSLTIVSLLLWPRLKSRGGVLTFMSIEKLFHVHSFEINC